VRTAVAIALFTATTPVYAGGMVLPVRGVRSLARGGAFVAGADDADSLWQNPAGLAHATGDGKRQLLFDLALVYEPVDYTALDGSSIANQQPSQPIPALAGSLGIGDRLVIAGGIATPYAALHRYPVDSIARYQSVSWSGSAFVLVTAGAAYAVSDRLRVGATLQNQFSKLAWSVVANGCPPMTTCAADDRSFDMPIELAQTDYLSPSGSLGAQLDVSPYATLGLAIQAPIKVAGHGTLKAKLPSNTLFTNARITGDDVAIAFTLPPALRLGIEARPIDHLRVEAALDIELWSLHDDITIEPDKIAVENVMNGPYAFRSMPIARDFDTSYAASVGAEYHGDSFALAAGYAYETAAAPAATTSVLTVDGNKHLLSVGGGYEDAGWQIGGALAYVRVADTNVSAADAKVQQLAPLRDAPVDMPINAGRYTTSYVLAGLRFARRW
jgi:long-chain fatty acid transport protein